MNRNEFCDKPRHILDFGEDISHMSELVIYEGFVRYLPRNLHKRMRCNSGLNHDIDSIPDEIGDFTHLKSLKIESSRRLEYLPDSINKLTNLTSLQVFSCNIKQIPDFSSNIVSSGYSSSIFDEPTRLRNNVHLTKLDLFNNNINLIPESIICLKNLRTLRLSKNNIKAVPQSIGYLTSLVDLDLAHNKIRTIPHSIGNLTNLKRLRLVHNMIEIIPPSIGKLAKLEYFDLNANKIDYIPSTIVNIKNLSYFNICENNSIKIGITSTLRPTCNFYFEAEKTIFSASMLHVADKIRLGPPRYSDKLTRKFCCVCFGCGKKYAKITAASAKIHSACLER